MKRFASHYLFLAGKGFLKHAYIEVCNGYVTSLRLLTEEIESAEWLPGAILILPFQEQTDPFRSVNCSDVNSLHFTPEQLTLHARFINTRLEGDFIALPEEENHIALYFPHFDFTAMQPVAGTPHRLLR